MKFLEIFTEKCSHNNFGFNIEIKIHFFGSIFIRTTKSTIFFVIKGDYTE